MAQIKLTQILFLCTFLKRTAQDYVDSSCESTDGQSNMVRWPSTNANTLSTPPCVDKNKEFLYRECKNGQWGPEPTCFYVQQEIPKCPEGFTALERICYIFTSKSTYPPLCPSQDILSFTEYKFIIPQDKTVWMPVERDLNNGLGFFQWTEASSLYKTEFNEYSVFVDPDAHDAINIEDLSCIVTFGGDQMVATSCNETFVGVCAYKMTNGWAGNKFCESLMCSQKDFFDKSQCLCQGEAPKVQSSDVEFLTPHQNQAYYAYFTGACGIALQKLNGTYTWVKSMQEINYTHWSEDVVFDDTHIYGAVKGDGSWILTESQLNCSLYVQNLAISEPFLNLTILNSTLTLRIENFDFLKPIAQIPVYCFTNADATTLIYRYPSLKEMLGDGSSLSFEFETITEAPGHYWCEGFTFVSTTVVKSNVVLSELAPGYSEFVILLSVGFSYRYGVDPVSKITIDLVDSTLFKIFRNDDDLKNQHTLRVMKFVKVDYENHTVLLNLHMTSLKTLGEERYDYKVVKLLIHEIVSTIERMQIVGFFSAEYCHRETSNNLTWSDTQIGRDTMPNEFCFTKHGTVVRRLCGGNFIDGAQWLDYEHCNILSKSNLSGNILVALSSTKNQGKEVQVYKISMRYFDMKSLDLYLIGEVFKTLNASSVNVESVTKTINNIMQISDKSIFKEAQLKAKAMDTILNFFEEIILNYNESLYIGLNNFVLASLKIESLSGLVADGNDRVQVLHGNHTIDDVQQMQNVKHGVWLSAASDKTEKVCFSLFVNDNFFPQSVDIPHDVRTVFGAVLPAGTKAKVFYKLENNETVEHCLLWDRTKDKNRWIVIGQPQMYPSFAVCEYANTGYFGLSLGPKIIKNYNITHDLIDVLTSNDSSSKTVQRLSNITDNYKNFKPIDVCYVGRILRKVSTDQLDLNCLVKAVSNLQKIEKSVLFESQMDGRDTDVILYYVDAILKLQEYHQDVIQVFDDNFKVLVVNATNFQGIALLNEKLSDEIKILDENSSIDDILKNDNFDSAVLIDPAIRNQLVNNSKIIITVFTNDALFNEANPKQMFIPKIFGIILPEAIEYSGPISVLHNINKSNSYCAYWKYDKSVNTTGFWKHDNATKLNYGVSQCDYWHTTHFALLLVDIRSGDLNPATFDTLDVVVTVNSVVSLFGLHSIVLTAVLFKKWRANTGNQLLLNFAVIIIFQIGAFYVSSTVTFHSDHRWLCIAAGVVLHYCTISEFFWMLVVAILQFRRLVVVLKAPPKKVLLKACLFGWALPLVPVITVLAVDRDTYVRGNGLCYPSGWNLYLGVWLPIAIVVVINSAIFVKILYNVFYKKCEITSTANNEMIYQVRLMVLLFFMFGLTWVFGFLSNFHDAEIFVYLFCCTSSLQGFVISAFFVLCNTKTKYLYIGKCKK